MKNLTTTLRAAALFCCLFCAAFTADAQIVNIPDANFKAALVSSLCVDTNGDGLGDADADLNNDGEIQVSEALGVDSLNVSCSLNQLTSLNLQGLNNLQELYCDDNQLTILNLQGLTNLQQLVCTGNALTSLDVLSLTNLHILLCSYNLLKSLSVQNSRYILFYST